MTRANRSESSLFRTMPSSTTAATPSSSSPPAPSSRSCALAPVGSQIASAAAPATANRVR